MDGQRQRDRLLRKPPLSRRQVLRGGALGFAGLGAAALFGCGGDTNDAQPTPAAPTAEPPPEVTRIRLPKSYAACTVPLLIARRFLREEGFTEVEYTTVESKYYIVNEYLAPGRFDFAFFFAPQLIFAVDAGEPIVLIAGAHVACFELYARPDIRTVSDLRGRKVGHLVRAPHPADFAFVSSVLQYIGITPGTEAELVAVPPGGLSGGAFDSGLIDALFAYPPGALSMRDTNQGHVILDSMSDLPWSQHICCYVAANRDFISKYPVATKRTLRAILRAVDHCRTNPEEAAHEAYDQAWVTPLTYAQQSVQMANYGVWRSFDPEDSLRFYALRLRETGHITANPDDIIRRGTDWTLLNELKREMAAAPFSTPPPRAGLLACDTDTRSGLPLLRRAQDLGWNERRRL